MPHPGMVAMGSSIGRRVATADGVGRGTPLWHLVVAFALSAGIGLGLTVLLFRLID